MDKDSKFTRDKEGFVAVRVVAGREALPATDKDYMFGRDTNGNIAVRVIGSAGSVDEEQVIIKTAEMPAASEEEYGKMRIFDGATTSAYTHGYIYECVGTGDPVVYSWVRIDVQPVAKLGRYLSGWNCATGLATTNPQESPYEYTTGDYFIVKTVATGGAANYRPDGSSYVIGQASTAVEASVVSVGDTYLYDGTSWTLLKTGSAVTSINGQVGDVSIKSVNGNSLMGSGNVELSTYLPYPAGWTTNSTTKAFCDDIAADTSAVAGKAYLGEVTCSDLPASMGNAEIVVEIMAGTTANNKVIVLTCTSGNTAPYMWKYTYWNNGTDVSGWKGFQEQLVSGTNIKTINSNSILGSGNLDIDALPSQTGQAGKVLATDGTNASWETPTTITMRTWGANE